MQQTSFFIEKEGGEPFHRDKGGAATGRQPKAGCILIEMTGRRFGRLTVTERAGKNRKGEATWHCDCDCGKVITASGTSLRSGNTQSCGCLRYEHCGSRAVEMVGRRFGKWKVLGPSDARIGGHAAWKCECACGSIRSVSGDDLRRGRSGSCGRVGCRRRGGKGGPGGGFSGPSNETVDSVRFSQ